MHDNIMKASIFTNYRGRWGLPLLFWGMPGTAKTKLIEEICRRYGMPYETLSPSERGEGAFGVVPVPSMGMENMSYLRNLSDRVVQLTSGKRGVEFEEAFAQALRENPKAETVLTYPRPEWTDKFATSGFGVVFVDEVTSTAPALQAPLMGLILERRIGGYILPPGVRILAAANPVEIAAGGFDLAAPLANRMGHIEWAAPTVEEHTQFMMRGSSSMDATQKLIAEMDEDAGDDSEDAETPAATYDVKSEEERVMKAWPNAWARAVGYETSFLKARPGLKNKMPQSGDAKTGRAWPSDRTWDFATHAFASGLVHGLSQAEREMFIESYIGAANASEWFEYMEKNDLPDPSRLLDGKEKFVHERARLDRTVAVLQSCVTLVVPPTAEKRAERSDALWGLLEKMLGEKADLDLIVPSVQALIDASLHSMKVSARTLAVINPLLKKANIGARRR